MLSTAEGNQAPVPAGRVLHAAAGYDLLLWLVTFGRERAFREKMLRLARLCPGESVLDVGCGTGTLAIAAARQVGPTGKVCGLDASPEMISRAQKKARSAGAAISFQNAFAQTLPFPDASFDIVLATLMLHHLPKPARREFAAGVRRVLKPGGRVLVIDFGPEPNRSKRWIDHIHRRHGHVELQQILSILADAGLKIVESGALGTRNLHYVLAAAPPFCMNMPGPSDFTGMRQTPGRTALLAILAAILIAVHGFLLYRAVPHLAMPAGLIAAIVFLVAMKHLGLFGFAVTLFRRCLRKR